MARLMPLAWRPTARPSPRPRPKPSEDCPTPWPSPSQDRFPVDRLAALIGCIKSVRRGGTVSVSGVYGGEIDPLPMMEMFDRGITMRLGQCHVRRGTDDLQKV